MMGIGELVKTQAGIFVYMIMLGVLLFLAYDGLRIFRRIVVHRLWAIAVEDIFYWIVWTWTVFYNINQVDNGVFRGFSLGGILIGMLMYYGICSRFVISFMVFVLRWMICILKQAVQIILYPFAKLYKLLAPSGRYMKNKVGVSFRFTKKHLKNCFHAVKMGISKK